jgi:hypothetical protein
MGMKLACATPVVMERSKPKGKRRNNVTIFIFKTLGVFLPYRLTS